MENENPIRSKKEGILGRIVAGAIALGTGITVTHYLATNPSANRADDFGIILGASLIIGLAGSYISTPESYEGPEFPLL